MIDDSARFNQSLAFSACIIKDAELSLKMLKVLMEMGVDCQKEDSLKQIPLFYASREGHLNVISHLVNVGSPNVLNRQDKYGQTAIYYAVREGHIRVV